MKNAKIFFTFLICIYFFFPVNAIAEFYNYTDDSGVVHYTQDYSTIPDKYKSQIEINQEIQSENTDQPDEEAADLEDSAQENTGDEFEEKSKELTKRGSELDDMYSRIKNMEQELNEYREEIKNKKEADIYKERMEKLNNLVEEYEKKRSKLNKDIEAFNNRVAEKNEENVE
ncbi:MAG: DUF4124 domain-containing protein [Thermodesulfobacteriota bacterium]